MNDAPAPGDLVVGLHHVQISCPAGSEDVLRGFYAGVLGMVEVPKPPLLAARGGVWFRAGTCEVHYGVEQEFVPARKAHPGIAVSDVDAAAERVAAAGLPVRCLTGRRPPTCQRATPSSAAGCAASAWPAGRSTRSRPG